MRETHEQKSRRAIRERSRKRLSIKAIKLPRFNSFSFDPGVSFPEKSSDSEEESDEDEDFAESRLCRMLGDLTQYSNRIVVEFDHPILEFLEFVDLPGLKDSPKLDSLVAEEMLNAELGCYVASAANNGFGNIDLECLRMLVEKMDECASRMSVRNSVHLQYRLLVSINKADLGMADFLREILSLRENVLDHVPFAHGVERKKVHRRLQREGLNRVRRPFRQISPRVVLLTCSSRTSLQLPYYRRMSDRFKSVLYSVLRAFQSRRVAARRQAQAKAVRRRASVRQGLGLVVGGNVVSQISPAEECLPRPPPQVSQRRTPPRNSLRDRIQKYRAPVGSGNSRQGERRSSRKHLHRRSMVIGGPGSGRPNRAQHSRREGSADRRMSISDLLASRLSSSAIRKISSLEKKTKNVE